MSALSADEFSDYFNALHDRCPYPWQRRLAALAANGDWPGAIDLPTGSGKTACIDIALFALACQASRPVDQRTAPRRIFFAVNRRVIVDEAHRRACRIAKRLWDAERNATADANILSAVAAALRQLAGTTARDPSPPLDVIELRGGIFRDNRWARSATQPTVVCTTIDQLGSRLLFRGYGVSPNAAPIQAALIAYDSLVLLDEAHISEPFRQTVRQVQSYLDPRRNWSETTIGARPLVFVPMTATPPHELPPGDVVRLDDEDRSQDSLARRLAAAKPATLRDVPDVAKAAVLEVERLSDGEPRAIAIIVNRVATAREVFGVLHARYPDANVELVIGSMRPIDRDLQAERLQPFIGPERPDQAEQMSVTIATQCLECGADFDFDFLIAECASLDALRQRFGRLNRRGRPANARAVILANTKAIKGEDALEEGKPLDPIYGNALARTWNWLRERSREAVTDDLPADTQAKKGRANGKATPVTAVQTASARVVDFGIDAFETLLQDQTGDGRIPGLLLAPSASLDAPILLPAYLDCWCQTSPVPAPDPDVTLFIHGRQTREPDLQVCWRSDLTDGDDRYWCDIVALLPPTAAECMSVPVSRIRRWLSHCDQPGAADSDSFDADDDRAADETDSSFPSAGVIWRGARTTQLLKSARAIRPGDTLVLSASVGGWDVLGHVPGLPAPEPSGAPLPEPDRGPNTTAVADVDVAEEAFRRARDRAVLRLHPSRAAFLPDTDEFRDLMKSVSQDEEPLTRHQLTELMNAAAAALTDDQEPLRGRLKLLADPKHGKSELYPDRRGLVIMSRTRLDGGTRSFLPPPLDEGDDQSSRTARESAVSLTDHTHHVCETLSQALSRLPLGALSEAFRLAAERHDWGKADERFQAMLRRTDRADAWLFTGDSPNLLAKSPAVPATWAERQRAREQSGLPSGFRHEMLSVQLAGRANGARVAMPEQALVLHLIASHHGYARPFAPVVVDLDPPDVAVEDVELPAMERGQCPPHSLDSGIAERFWTLTRRYGWWGLPYVESLLRLADQQASADEDAGKYDGAAPKPLEDNR